MSKNQELRIKNQELLGFTLIELLIVMAIIGILSTISLFALQGTRESARDARRKADLETIRSALELYRSDCHEYVTQATVEDVDTVFGTQLSDGDGSCTGANGNVYLEEISTDPASDREYRYFSETGASYILCAGLEDDALAAVDCDDVAGNDTCGTASCNYMVRNP